jgi:hypothetical protein
MTRRIVLIIDLLFVALLILGVFAIHQKHQSETCSTDTECEQMCMAAGGSVDSCSI